MSADRTASGDGEYALVDVGGYRLALHCIGEGSPTVVLETGLGAPSEYLLGTDPAGDSRARPGLPVRSCRTGKERPGTDYYSSHVRRYGCRPARPPSQRQHPCSLRTGRELGGRHEPSVWGVLRTWTCRGLWVRSPTGIQRAPRTTPATSRLRKRHRPKSVSVEASREQAPRAAHVRLGRRRYPLVSPSPRVVVQRTAATSGRLQPRRVRASGWTRITDSSRTSRRSSRRERSA